MDKKINDKLLRKWKKKTDRTKNKKRRRKYVTNFFRLTKTYLIGQKNIGRLINGGVSTRLALL